MITILSFEFDLDLTVIQRIGYTIPDLLSDIGGIEALTFSLFSIILRFWNYNNLDNHLISKFFKLKDKSQEENRAINKIKTKD